MVENDSERPADYDSDSAPVMSKLVVLFNVPGLPYRLKKPLEIGMAENRDDPGNLVGYLASHFIPDGTDNGEAVVGRGNNEEEAARNLIIALGKKMDRYRRVPMARIRARNFGNHQRAYLEAILY